MNKLSSLERFNATIEGKIPDRVPMGYLFFGAGLHILSSLKSTFKSVYYSAGGIAEAQKHAVKLFGFDNVMAPWGCLTVEAEALGCKIIVRENDYPYIVEAPVKDKNVLKNVRIPDSLRDGRMPIVLDALRKLMDDIGDETFIIGLVNSPFLVASHIRGMENLIVDLVRDPDFAHNLLTLVTGTCLDFGGRMVDEKLVHAVMIENSYASREIVSPTQCNEFIMTYTKKLVDRFKKNAYVIEHNCSSSPYIDAELNLGVDVLNLWMGDVKKVKEKYSIDCKNLHTIPNGCKSRVCIEDIKRRGGETCFMGNVDHTVTMLSGSPKDVEEEAKNCIQRGKDGGRFILSTGCEIPFNAPMENVKALVQAVEKYGRYQ